jgi:NAD(P)-dependent dehydrogenase (short-subunit alcohol dehydrogenase family)
MVSPVVFITGAGSGIGLASAKLLAATGHELALMDLDDIALSAAAAQMAQQHGTRVRAIAGDIASEEDMDRAMAAVQAEWGRLDGVVANAGINGVWAPIDDLTVREWDETIRVNLRGTFVTLNRTVPLLKRAGGGSIVIVASINGVRTFTNPGATAYSASKAAQFAIAQQLSLELGRHNVRINVVCPGAIETNIDSSTEIRLREQAEIPVIWPKGSVPLSDGKPGRAEDVAKTIAFLLDDASSHITGSPIFVDGGQGLLR